MTRGYLASLAQARADTSHQAEEEARAHAPECTREQNLQAVQLILDQLHATGIPLDDLEPATADRCLIATQEERTRCDECEHDVRRAWVYGAYRLCRSCATRRLQLHARLTADPSHVPATERAAA